jgi:hypothetical protein
MSGQVIHIHPETSPKLVLGLVRDAAAPARSAVDRGRCGPRCELAESAVTMSVCSLAAPTGARVPPRRHLGRGLVAVSPALKPSD